MYLDQTIYDTIVLANWNGGIVSADEVTATVQMGPGQDIRWKLESEDSVFLIIPTSDIATIVFDLEEGHNSFFLEVDSLNETDEYYLSVVRDTIPPLITLSEKANRSSTLETTRIFEGTCEGGANILIWSDVDSQAMTCPSSGTFSVEMDILDVPGLHDIYVISTDSANNEASSKTSVLKQNWPDWAIDDAKNKGPMLIWFSLAGFLVSSCVLLAIRRILIKEDNNEISALDPDFDLMP
jgi:hypothetical protein